MPQYLLIDLGSTFTKLTLVNTDINEIVATSSSFTTIQTDVKEGFYNALKQMEQKLNKNVSYDKALACSSASGGLNMVAIGLVPELTAEAAKRVCLGSGAKVNKVYSFSLSQDEIKEIEDSNADIILLAGGTDGGNKNYILENSEKLANSKINIPIIYAGNKDLVDEVKQILKAGNKTFYISDNVMPKLNKLNILKTKELIQALFVEHIIKAKGLNSIEAIADNQIIPTPSAVLKAAELLNEGIDNHSDFGEIIIADVGGATTDIYSIAEGNPKSINTFLTGLEEPFSKRTVEGDLGMRYSASGVLNILSEFELKEANKLYNIEQEIEYRKQNQSHLPKTNKEKEIDAYIAGLCINKAFSRHVGTVNPFYTHGGMSYQQIGKDLTTVKTVIGTGGVIVFNEGEKILLNIMTDPKKLNELRPLKANFYIDKDYILSAAGLLSTIDKEAAYKLLKKYLVEVWNGKNKK